MRAVEGSWRARSRSATAGFAAGVVLLLLVRLAAYARDGSLPADVAELVPVLVALVMR
ncbi:MAG TPA: hypothetical protein VHJ34_06745 [Actinomycetota bacterium]|nr:hypothetical protein [Actinomycetota bacterium]